MEKRENEEQKIYHSSPFMMGSYKFLTGLSLLVLVSSGFLMYGGYAAGTLSTLPVFGYAAVAFITSIFGVAYGISKVVEIKTIRQKAKEEWLIADNNKKAEHNYQIANDIHYIDEMNKRFNRVQTWDENYEEPIAVNGNQYPKMAELIDKSKPGKIVNIKQYFKQK